MTNPLFSVRRSLSLILSVGAISAALFLTLTSAEAARGGQGKGNGTPGGGSTETTAASPSINPNPVSAFGGQYALSGSGFKPNAGVWIIVSQPACCFTFTLVSDASGNISAGGLTAVYPGTYKAKVYQRLKGKKLTLVATTFFESTWP